MGAAVIGSSWDGSDWVVSIKLKLPFTHRLQEQKHLLCFLVTHVDLIWLIESIRLWGEPMDRLPRFWSAVNLQGETPQKQGEKAIECIAIDMFIFAFICV